VRIYPSLILRQQDEESSQREYVRFVNDFRSQPH